MSRFGGDAWDDIVSEAISEAAPDAWDAMTREQRHAIAEDIGREAAIYDARSGHWPDARGFKDRELSEARAEIARLTREVERLRAFEPRREPMPSLDRIVEAAAWTQRAMNGGAAARKDGAK